MICSVSTSAGRNRTEALGHSEGESLLRGALLGLAPAASYPGVNSSFTEEWVRVSGNPGRNVDVLDFWKQNQDVFPLVLSIFQRPQLKVNVFSQLEDSLSHPEGLLINILGLWFLFVTNNFSIQGMPCSFQSREVGRSQGEQKACEPVQDEKRLQIGGGGSECLWSGGGCPRGRRG